MNMSQSWKGGLILVTTLVLCIAAWPLFREQAIEQAKMERRVIEELEAKGCTYSGRILVKKSPVTIDFIGPGPFKGAIEKHARRFICKDGSKHDLPD
jgi:hypothetical protein